MKEGRQARVILSIVLIVAALTSFGVRMAFGEVFPLFSGTWLRSVFLGEAAIEDVAGFGGWFADGAGMLGRVFVIVSIVAAVIGLLSYTSQAPKPLRVCLWLLLPILTMTAIPMFAIPFSLLAVLAVLLLPLIGMGSIAGGVMSLARGARLTTDRLAAVAMLVGACLVALAGFDWLGVALTGVS